MHVFSSHHGHDLGNERRARLDLAPWLRVVAKPLGFAELLEQLPGRLRQQRGDTCRDREKRSRQAEQRTVQLCRAHQSDFAIRRSGRFRQIPWSFLRDVSIGVRNTCPDLVKSAIESKGMEMRSHIAGKLSGVA